MKEIVVISGKGGTGKTTFLGYLATVMKDKVLADCDVDAPNLHLMLNPKIVQSERFIGSKIATIDDTMCSGCGWCIPACRFDAIQSTGNPCRGKIKIDADACEGCALCARICDNGAIEMKDRYVGDWFVSETNCGTMVHALLEPGAENSGKLVAMVKQKARMVAMEQGIPLILVDGPPGVGCPVISSLSGASIAVIVTEPTSSGLNDLERVLDLLQGFKVRAAIIVNRYDINVDAADSIERMAMERGVDFLGKIPYDETLAEEMAKGNVVDDRLNCPAIDAMRQCWERLSALLEEL